jgi:RNA polymerase sigma factor (sigma-70 family)
VNVAGRIRGLLERLLARRHASASEGVPDSELLRRFTRERDEAAFELLVWRHGGMVLGMCRRAIRDEQLAEDAFQAVFLVLARKAAAIHGNLGGWLFKVTRRVSARAVKNRPAMQPSIEMPAAPVPDSTERDELSALLDYEVARLPERLRRPVILCYLGGHSTEDAARELGCPRGTVLSRLATARKCLAERLTRRGVTLPATLVVAGLSGRLISMATASVPSFLTDVFTLSTATHLAEGVLRTMSRATLLTAMGGVIIAAGLATGVGWVAAQPGPKVEGGPPHAVANPGALAVNPPKPAQTDPVAERRAADERLKKLEHVAESMRSEIETTEKQIDLLARANGGRDIAARLAILQKRYAEVDEEFNRATREITKLEAEVGVLKKMLNDNEALQPDSALVQEAVKRDPAVIRVAADLERARVELAHWLQLSQAADTPEIKDMRTKIATVEKEYKAARERVTVDAAETLRAGDKAVKRQRLIQLDIDIQIKKEIREKLREERDAIKKLLDAGAGGDINLEEMRKSLEPQREVLARVQREILLMRVQRDGITLSDPMGTEAKLDAILRELATLRKEVKELKEQKK